MKSGLLSEAGPHMLVLLGVLEVRTLSSSFTLLPQLERCGKVGKILRLSASIWGLLGIKVGGGPYHKSTKQPDRRIK